MEMLTYLTVASEIQERANVGRSPDICRDSPGLECVERLVTGPPVGAGVRVGRWLPFVRL